MSEIHNCARCGNDHTDVIFFALQKPADEWTHWATCPRTREPIFMRILNSQEVQPQQQPPPQQEQPAEAVGVPLERLRLWGGRIQRVATDLDISGLRDLAKPLWELLAAMTHEAQPLQQPPPPQQNYVPSDAAVDTLRTDLHVLERRIEAGEVCAACGQDIGGRAAPPQREPLSPLAQALARSAQGLVPQTHIPEWWTLALERNDLPAYLIIAEAVAELLRHQEQQTMARVTGMQALNEHVKRIIANTLRDSVNDIPCGITSPDCEHCKAAKDWLLAEAARLLATLDHQ